MMQMRARSWALRDGFADAIKGLQCREEVEDYEPRNVTPAPPIQAPRRLSERKAEPGPTEPNATTDHESISGEVLTPDYGAAVHVVKVSEKSGESKGRKWTAYFADFSDGRSAGTFDTKMADILREANSAGVPVIVAMEENTKNPGKFNLTEVAFAGPQERQPGEEG
jgi:hypothetical protein